MKAILAFFITTLMGFFVACSTIYDVQHDYDTQADFESLKTYNWMTVNENADIDSLNVERVKRAVNAELQAKGYKMTTNDPDFLIAEHLGTKDKVQITSWGYGYGSHRWYRDGYWAPGGITAYQYEEGSLIIDFIDAKSNKMIWRGVAKADLNHAGTPEENEKLINEAVQRILNNFPPKPKE